VRRIVSRGVQPASAGFVAVAGGFRRQASPRRANKPARRAEALGYGYQGHLRGLSPKLYAAPRAITRLPFCANVCYPIASVYRRRNYARSHTQRCQAESRTPADTGADDAEPTIVVLETGQQVVVIPLDEYTVWQETRYLLANPANAAHLRQSIAEAQAGANPGT
jgi:PHD/YefM family antitoxin component YafN of YafNO toxin-antitoxin module